MRAAAASLGHGVRCVHNKLSIRATPSGDAALPWEGFPCFISFCVGAWHCSTWAQPSKGSRAFLQNKFQCPPMVGARRT